MPNECEPVPYWLTDDDSIRRWVAIHSIFEIRALSTSIKIKMIARLMSGWISDDDMDAIGRICGSVVSGAESKAIQDSVNLLDFTSIGQRTRMRVFFAKMPRHDANPLLNYYHGTSLEEAKKRLVEELVPYEVPEMSILDWWEYTDFGKGFYCHLEENKKMAVDWAKRKNPEWGVVRFTLTKQEFDGLEGAPLHFHNKREHRPSNAPVLFEGKNANWIEFVEFNRHIRSSIQRPKDYDWTPNYPWMRGPFWGRIDSGMPGGGPPVPDHIQQINWGQTGLKALNTPTAKQRRFLITKENEHLLGTGAAAPAAVTY